MPQQCLRSLVHLGLQDSRIREGEKENSTGWLMPLEAQEFVYLRLPLLCPTFEKFDQVSIATDWVKKKPMGNSLSMGARIWSLLRRCLRCNSMLVF